jgi:phytoene dehydrogenase-like protein
MYELTRALVRVAQRLGVHFHFDEPVSGIDVSGKRIRGLVTPQRRLEVGQVIANADVAHVFGTLLAEHEPPRQQRSMSGWTAIVRARRRPRPSHGVLFPRKYRSEFVDIFDRSRCPSDPTVYVCAQEKAHRRAGWDDHEPLFVMANAPSLRLSEQPAADAYRELRDVVLRRLRSVEWLAPDDEVVWERTPGGLAARFPGSGGAIYGPASNSRFAAFQRAANRVPGVDGLYLASGSAHPGGGVPLCILSGAAAARAALEDE